VNYTIHLEVGYYVLEFNSSTNRRKLQMGKECLTIKADVVYNISFFCFLTELTVPLTDEDKSNVATSNDSVFIFVTVTSCVVHASFQITPHDYPLMHYTVLIGEENFTPGRPLVIVLPFAEEDSTSNNVRYLIQELHTSSRWPVLVFNVSNEMNRNKYTEIHQHYSYIILIAGSCKDWERNTSVLRNSSRRCQKVQ